MAELGCNDEQRNLVGMVLEFDVAVGLGTVEGPTGPVSFHCVEIADGSRHVEVGARVTFDLLPKLGRWEATAIRV